MQQVVIAGRYRLLELVGRGGMGRVWRARDETLHREVAVKQVLPPQWLAANERDELRRRTLREARTAARLSHPNVVHVYDVVQVDDDPWLVMEYVPSRSLQELVDAEGPVDPRRAAGIGQAVLAALGAAHGAGVLHRDVKPANVLLARDGRVLLTDFGLAVFDGGDGLMTRPGLVLGSPQYVAPERAAEGVSSIAADLWSLGATLHTAVEGRSPYARSTAMATLAALASQPPDPAPHAGPLEPVLAGLLRRDPRRRLRHDEAARLLAAAAAGVVIRRVPASARPDAPTWDGAGTAATPPAGGPPGARPAAAAPAWSRAAGLTGPAAATGPDAGLTTTSPPPAAGPTTSGPADLRPAASGPADHGPASSGPTNLGPTTSGPADHGPAASGPTNLGPAASGPTNLGPTTSGPANLGPAASGPTNLGPTTSGPANLGPAASGPAGAAAGGPAGGDSPGGRRQALVRRWALAAGALVLAVAAGVGTALAVTDEPDRRAEAPTGTPSGEPWQRGPGLPDGHGAPPPPPFPCVRPDPAGEPVTAGKSSPGTDGELPPGWVWYANATFRVAVPAGWRYLRSGNTTCFQDPVTNRILGVEPYVGGTDPVEELRSAERDLVGGGRLPGYERVRLAAVDGGAEWECRWSAPYGERLHALRALPRDGGTWTLGWTTSDRDWAAAGAQLAVIRRSFRPGGATRSAS
ncbi:protein kinase [Micromonospora sp. NPDC049836]|uniref:serine/threonine-protein kinase n=1 Tax=Micromonospora sp. NPDC049836 TaxID=3364274 RepID=UPI0037A7ED45